MKATYYIVQITPRLFIQRDEQLECPCYVMGIENATRFPSLSEARRVVRGERGKDLRCCGARRFPRILKVTTEVRVVHE